MTYSSGNSMVQRGGNPVSIESGQIINVDMLHWTVDVRTQHSHRILTDLQVGVPYLHFHSGEGIYAMPEVGAKVYVCLPSDSPPFVLCYITTFEQENTGGESTQSDSTEGSGREVTFRSGRPRLQQGDIMLRTRDANQIWLRRGGVVEIGSNHMAKRFYIPLTNMIRDVFENYEALSTAGEMIWKTSRADTEPDGDAKATFTVAARNFAQDEKASVMIRAGAVDDTLRLRCVVSPDDIDSSTGEVGGDPVYDFTIDEEGNFEVTAEGDGIVSITGSLDLTVEGDGTLTFSSDLTQNVSGDYTISVNGEHEVTASNSTERISGSKKIVSSSIRLGGENASKAVMLVTPSVISFMGYHTHEVIGTVTGTPTVPVTQNQMAAQKVYGE